MELVRFDGSQTRGDVGHFSYDVASETWTWSAGMFAIHGYVDGEVPATTAVLLSHKHPDDAARAEAVMRDAMTRGGVFSCYHRVIDSGLRTRFVVSVGRGLTDPTGEVVAVDGYFVDLTSPRRDDVENEVRGAVDGILAHRPVIDQAVGMIMMESGCDSDGAFDQLRRCSQHANVKVREVAQRVVESKTTHPEVLLADVLDGILAEARTRPEVSR